MISRIDIPEEFQHPGWSNEAYDDVHPSGFQYVDFGFAMDQIVKLEFYSDGAPAYGSGFFVNIPGATHAVILTAAHNLISPTGHTSTDLTVYLNPRRSATPEKIAEGIIPSEVDTSAAYKANQTPETDYGAILLSHNNGDKRNYKDRPGFAFNMKLAYENELEREIYVSGYRAKTPLEAPVTSSGKWLGCTAQQLEYSATTEQGISGSPVWIEYEGCQTVVAIHNHRPRDQPGTAELLEEVFKWASVGEYGVKLRAQDTRAKQKQTGTLLPKDGLYLNFREGFPFARVRLGTGTRFNVLPVYVTAEKELYALEMEGKWVVFDTARNKVILTEKLKDACLFMKGNFKQRRRTMWIVLGGGEIKMQLRMQGRRVRKFDGEYAESSEVSMVEYPAQNNELFTEFLFEEKQQGNRVKPSNLLETQTQVGPQKTTDIVRVR